MKKLLETEKGHKMKELPAIKLDNQFSIVTPIKVPFSEKQKEYFRSKGRSERWINFQEALLTNMINRQKDIK